MASNNKTPNLNLSQWELSDKPGMEDFNRDNLLLDAEVAKLYNALNQANKKIEALEQVITTKMDKSSVAIAPVFKDESISADDTTLPFSYYVSTKQNVPESYTFVFTMKHYGDVVQLGIGLGTGNVHVRRNPNAKGWTGWKQLALA